MERAQGTLEYGRQTEEKEQTKLSEVEGETVWTLNGKGFSEQGVINNLKSSIKVKKQYGWGRIHFTSCLFLSCGRAVAGDVSVVLGNDDPAVREWTGGEGAGSKYQPPLPDAWL